MRRVCHSGFSLVGMLKYMLLYRRTIALAGDRLCSQKGGVGNLMVFDGERTGHGEFFFSMAGRLFDVSWVFYDTYECQKR